jgi:adenylate kinase
MRLVFLGPPGAGKGTQSKWLIDYLGVPHLSTGDMLRAAAEHDDADGREVRQYLETGRLVPDPIVLNIVDHRLQEPDCQRGYLLDGFPRTLPQAEALDAQLASEGTPLDAVLELAVDEYRLRERLLGRGRNDDQADIVAQRLQVYRRQTAPLINYYFHQGLLRSIDGNLAVPEVQAQIKRIVDRIESKQDGMPR